MCCTTSFVLCACVISIHVFPAVIFRATPIVWQNNLSSIKFWQNKKKNQLQQFGKKKLGINTKLLPLRGAYMRV
jgi:hypothetical protein